MLLRGYIDESYDSRMFTLSCLISKPYEWMWFESAWKKVLARKNKELRAAKRPEIARFHASECNGRRGDFVGWSDEERLLFIKELLKVFEQRMTTVIAYSIPLDDYKVVFPEHSQNLIAGLYGSLLKFIMTELQAQIRDSATRGVIKPLQIEFVHDRTSSASHLHEAFRQMQQDKTFADRDRFRAISERSWEDCVALQAADLLAYESFRDSLSKVEGKDRRKLLAALLESPNFGGRARLFDRAGLERLKLAITETKTKRLLPKASA